MRKFYLSFIMAALFAGISFSGWGQCLTTPGGLWPTATYTPSCTGLAETIVTDGWAGEYSRVSVTTGTVYTFSSSVATDFITIADNPSTSTNPATTSYATGTGSVTWTSTVTGTIRFITHANAACATENVDRSRRVMCGTPLANDANVTGAFTVGKTPRSYATTYRAIVKNQGSGTLTNLNVTLNITGANTFTNTKVVASLASGAETTVTFDPFQSATAGTNNVAVSVPADDNNANNSKTVTQTVTTNVVGTSSLTTATTGVGNTSPIEFASRFRNTGTKTIDQLTLYLPSASTGQPYLVKIYDATGTGGTPGTALYTSPTQTTGGVNVNLAISPAVTVTGDFYVAISQTGSTNMGYGYDAQTPLEPATYYLNGTTGWADMALSGYAFRLMMDARFSAGLPVDLLSFAGYGDGKVNTLKWSTATESNNKGFELQRSTDGTNFSSISFIATKAEGGNSTSVLNYSYVDEKPFSGVNYYRLNQVDKDGKHAYSKIIDLKSKVSEISISSYPNPVKEVLNIKITSPTTEKLTIVVTDITGKVVMSRSANAIAGDNNQQMNVSQLAPGSYMIKAICASGCETAVQRFVKQ